ncbi:MAG TPA: Stp1/IreP family PP2C-type Ser/Thr phosphatase [Candidatus Polarisedimenticolia bacterium]|nr:Stp1/IreP family PP2C-type Ser/Thr phosphatase [Candidatus Polarisedimenticolia bacterium]
MRIASGGVTDVGRVRSNNEDCFKIVEPLNLFVLSDGMGGEAHGEIASAMAVETVVKHCLDFEANPAAKVVGAVEPKWSARTKRLSTAVHLANRNIFKSAEANAEQHGMGATLTAVWIDDAKLSVAHVGDSRAYLLRGGGLLQLTRDHSLVAEQVRRGILTAAEAEESDMQSVLLRALGAQAEIEVDAEEHTLFPRDVLLLCSDGLTRMVTEPEIAGTLQAETDPGRAAEKLVALANERGGPDNITVVIVRLDRDSKGWFSWLRGAPRKNSGSNGTGGN